jgi:hypothetical protein
MKKTALLSSLLFALVLLFLNSKNVNAAVDNFKEVFVTNWPAVQNVNLVNSSPIPVIVQNFPNSSPVPSGTPAPTSTPQPTSKVITIYNNFALTPNTEITSAPINIDGYTRMTVFVSKPNGNTSLPMFAEFSADGVNYTGGEPGIGISLTGGTHTYYKSIDIPGPYMKMVLSNFSSSPPPSVTVIVYLYR